MLKTITDISCFDKVRYESAGRTYALNIKMMIRSRDVMKIIPTVAELKPKNGAEATGASGAAQLPRRRRHPVKKGVIAQFHCPVAGCIYSSYSERHFACIKYLKQHYKKVHAPKSLTCERCERGFAVDADLAAHQLVCGHKYGCSCGAVFATREALLTHGRRKQHELPDEHKRTANRKGDQLKQKQVTVSKSTTFLMVVPDSRALAVANTLVSSTQKPCFILPKSASLSAMPLPMVAAMALSELSNCCDVGTRHSMATQTETITGEEGHCSCSIRSGVCKQDSGNQCHFQQPVKRSVETQTSRGSVNVVPRKRQKRVACRTTQTWTGPPTVGFSRSKWGSVGTLSPSDILRQQFVESHYEGAICEREHQFPLCSSTDLWQMASSTDSVSSPMVANDKPCQTIGELDVVSSGTQTSPRSSRFHNNPLCDHFLDGPLREYLAIDNLSDYSITLMASAQDLRCPDVETPQQLSSIETQTDVDLEDFLLCGAESGEADTQTQTSEDLESIPYDQLLSHMETQTSDLFFSELGGLCNMQTQTAYSDGTSIGQVDMHTQTSTFQPWKTSVIQLMDMETQTFLSSLEAVDDASQSDPFLRSMQ